MFNDSKKQVEELKKEVVNLKLRLKKVEEFCLAFPTPHVFLSTYTGEPGGRDELFEQAVRIVSQHDMASASLIQRRLQIGFNRAARLLEQLDEAGVVGPKNK